MDEGGRNRVQSFHAIEDWRRQESVVRPVVRYKRCEHATFLAVVGVRVVMDAARADRDVVVFPVAPRS